MVRGDDMKTSEDEVTTFPFTAVVGSIDVKLALLLCVIDPMIGGVLIRGERGAGKTTLVRGLASLLGTTVPFVELPMGATEDRVKGSLDVARALQGSEIVVQSGLLGRANGGILYVDEINLLPDHIVDLILDASATGVNIVERDGVSLRQLSRFILVGTMNPEEGDLRPQLLDRFGLCLDGDSIASISDRMEAVRRRLRFEADPIEVLDGVAEEEVRLKERLMRARDRLRALSLDAALNNDVLTRISERSQAEGVQGLRGDLTLARAARALALFEDREAVDFDDVDRVAPMVFLHRRRLSPLDRQDSSRSRSTAPKGDAQGTAGRDSGSERDRRPPQKGGGVDPSPTSSDAPRSGGSSSDHLPEEGNLAEAMSTGASGQTPDAVGAAELEGSPPRADDSTESDATTGERALDHGDRAPKAMRPEGEPRLSTGASAPPLFRGVRGDISTGRPSFERSPTHADQGGASVHLLATVRAMVERRGVASDRDGSVPNAMQLNDLRYRQRAHDGDQCVVFVVDASGSMGAEERMRLARESAVALLQQAYQRRLKVALVTFAGGSASLRLRPTKSVEVAVARFDAVTYGGRTPLGDGLARGIEVVQEIRRSGMSELVVLLTDGRVNQGVGSGDPLADAMAQAERMAALAIRSVVCDFEDSSVPLGLAKRFADAMGATYLPYGGLVTTEI